MIDEGAFCPACRDNEAYQAICPSCSGLVSGYDAISADIAKRNAGAETLTVWTDGGWKVWGLRDAEVATLCEPEKVLLNIRLDTRDAVEFRPFQERVTLYEKVLGVSE